MNTFDCLKEVITNKTGKLISDPEFKSGWGSFMIIRYLSMDMNFFRAAEAANKFQCDLSDKQMYKYLLAKVPSRRNSFIRYISKKKK